MSENIASIGVKFDGTDLEKGRIALDAIAAAGPKVEAALKSVEGSAGKTGKTLASLGKGAKVADLGKDGATAAAGMEKLGAASAKAGDAIKASATATKSAASSYDAMKAAVSSFTVAEAAHIQKLVEEYKQLGMNRGQLEAYKAAQAGMGKGAQEIAGAIAQKTEALKREQQAVQSSAASMGGLAAAGRLAAGALAAIGVGNTVGSFIKMADASTNMASRLGLVTSSASELIVVQQRLFAIAQSSRVGFVELADTYAQMARSTKELGVSQDAMLGVTKTISQALTISGSSAASAQAALMQLSQGFASGTLRGEELNSILEQTPRLAQAIANGLDVSVGKLREMGAAGELTAEKVVGALQKSAAGVEAEFERMATTVDQASTRAANSITRIVGAVDKMTGATSVLAGGISRVSTLLDTLSASFEKIDKQAPLREASAEVLNLHAAAERMRKGMASGILGPNAQGELDRINARLAEAKKRFNDLDRQLGGAGSTKDPRDQSGFPSRSESYAKEAKRQEALNDSLNGYRLKRDGVPASYIKDMQEIIRLNKEGKLVGDEYTRALKEQQTLLSKGGGGGGKGASRGGSSAQSTYADTIKMAEAGAKLAESLLAVDSGLSGDFAEKWAKLGAAYKAGAVSLSDLTEAQSLLLADQPAMKAASADALKTALATQAARSKEADGIKAWMQAQEDAAAQSLKSVSDRIISLQNEEEAAKLSAAQNITLAQAIERTALARLREKQTGFREGSDGFNALQQEIEARERIIELISAKEQREAADASNKALVQQWDETVKQYDDIFRQGFADMLNKGEDGWKSFTKSLRTTFKTAVADQLYKSFAQPFVVKIVASLLGITGGGAAMAGGGGAAQNISNLNSLAGAASQAIWGGTVGASAASLAGANVVGAFGGDAIGALIAGNGAWAGVAVEAGAAAGSAAAAAGSAASAASSIGSAIAAAGPWAAAAMALYSIIKSFDDSGTIHTGAGSIYSADKGLRGGQDLFYSGKDKFGMAAAYSAGAQANVDSIAQSLGTALDSVAVSFGQKAGYEIATAFADDTSKDGAWGQLRISKDGKDLLNWEDTRKSKWAPKEFSDGEAGYKEYLAAVAKDTRQVLLDMDLPSWADTMLESIGETASMEQLAGVITQIGQVQSVFVQLGKTMDSFAGMTDKTFEALMKASGGIGALQQNLGAYYENFYSEEERMAKATAQLTAELAKSGISMPASKDAYRALVTQALEAGEGSAELAAKLLQLSPAFAQVADFAEQAAKAAADAAKEAARNARDSLFRSLQNAIALERAQLDIQRGLAQESVSMVTGVFRMVRDNARDLYGEVQQAAVMQAAQGSAFIDKALAAARSSGALPDSDALGTAIGAARSGLQVDSFASQAELEFQKLVLAGKLTELGDISEVQLSTAELTLKAAELQVKRLDQTLDYWRQQIDIANGNVDATLSVAAAVESLKKRMFPDRPEGKAPSSPFAIGGGSGGSAGPYAPTASAKDWENEQIRTLVGGVYGGSTDFSDPAALAKISSLAGLQHWTGAQMDEALGLPAGTVKDMMLGAGFDWWKGPKYAAGGMHAGGLRLVGERGPEIEATGPSRIWNAQQIGAAMGGGSAEMVAELRALRAELAQLKALQAEGNKAASDTHNLLDRVTAGGNAMATEVMA